MKCMCRMQFWNLYYKQLQINMCLSEVKFHSVITAFLDESHKNYGNNYLNNEWFLPFLFCVFKWKKKKKKTVNQWTLEWSPNSIYLFQDKISHFFLD